jgi:inosine-uridine nucleoside N-ribohydrolase
MKISFVSGFSLALLLAGFALAPRSSGQTPAPDPASPRERIPVIIDTDIGDDIDDSWALVLALKNPDLDIKLVSTTYLNSEYRARLAAKYLTIAGRTDIPIGLGPDGNSGNGQKMARWVEDFKLSDYRGKVLMNGAQAVVDTINQSPVPVTVIAIGPLNTLGAALKKDPGIAAKANFVGMQGSVYKGYGGSPVPVGEYNVHRDVPDAKLVLAAPWKSIAITPLDTCSLVNLTGERLLKLRESSDPLLKALIQSNLTHNDQTIDLAKFTFSGTCFDDVAVYMADSNNGHRLLNYEKLKIAVDDRGFTVVSPTGTEMEVATTWLDKAGFLDYMVNVLLYSKP